ncbi:MAG: carbohydrate-binding protein [Burkholderiales bacterium]|nr:carbohydrate-binding protein [Phycisphaerae bacterium]
MILLTTITALVGSPCVAADAITTEPYAWNSVTIKANGFINGIVYSPVQKNLVYMHTDMGGAYRWDESDKKWTCLTDWIQHDDASLNHMGVETLAVDPTDANRVYVACGTYMGRSAILRSTDQGRTFARTNVPFEMNGNGSARNAGERMMVDPNLPSTLLYGTRTKGLWKSADHAATWTRVDSFSAVGERDGNAINAGIVWTQYDKSSGTPGQGSRTIYAGVMTVKEDKVFRSLDGGATWSPIPGQPGGQLLPTRNAISPDGKTLYLTYTIGDRNPGPHGIVGGGLWKVENPASDSPVWTDIAPDKGNFGWSGVSMDAGNPKHLLITTLCRYATKDDVYRTTDAGATWKPLLVDKHRDDSSAPYAKHSGTHWTGDVQIDPFNPDVAMYTTGYGLYRSANVTSPEPTWVFFNEGFEQSAVLELASPPSGTAHLLSAIGDRDGYRHDDFTISPVHGQFGGEQKRSMGTCSDLEVAWNDPSVVIRSRDRAQFSFDGGITWDWFTDPSPRPAAAPAATQPRGQRGVNVAISADGKRVIASTPTATVHATRQGNAWSEWTPGGNADSVRGANVISDTVNSARFYARSGSDLFTTTDGGETWIAQTTALPAGIGWMRVAIGHEGHLWASTRQRGLHRSTDSGKTWSHVAADVVTVANQVGVGAPAPGKNYPAIFVAGKVGGVNGFFRSDDQGATWVKINDDQHHYGFPTVIQGDSRIFGRLYVGTNGRGIVYGERK